MPDRRPARGAGPDLGHGQVGRRRAASGSRTSTCRTRTRTTRLAAPTRWAAGTTAPGSGRRCTTSPAWCTARSPTRTTTPSTGRGSPPVIPGHAEPVARARGVHGHAGGQRHRLPVPARSSRKAYRFRILNASNDRILNLQLYYAESNKIAKVTRPARPTLPDQRPARSTMVAGRRRTPTARPGRPPGRPTAATAACRTRRARRPEHHPDRHRGRLPADAGRAAQHARRLQLQPPRHRRAQRRQQDALPGPGRARRRHRRLLAGARRPKLILYNDAPAPVPAFDPRYDYYTGDPDQTDTGRRADDAARLRPQHPHHHAVPGRRPPHGQEVRPEALKKALPAAYEVDQPAPIVPEKAYGAATNTYSRIQDTRSASSTSRCRSRASP